MECSNCNSGRLKPNNAGADRMRPEVTAVAIQSGLLCMIPTTVALGALGGPPMGSPHIPVETLGQCRCQARETAAGCALPAAPGARIHSETATGGPKASSQNGWGIKEFAALLLPPGVAAAAHNLHDAQRPSSGSGFGAGGLSVSGLPERSAIVLEQSENAVLPGSNAARTANLLENGLREGCRGTDPAQATLDEECPT